MVVKIFFYENKVSIYHISEFHASPEELVLLIGPEKEVVFDRNNVKNYTVYTHEGMQIHTTYSKNNTYQNRARPNYGEPMTSRNQ